MKGRMRFVESQIRNMGYRRSVASATEDMRNICEAGLGISQRCKVDRPMLPRRGIRSTRSPKQCCFRSRNLSAVVICEFDRIESHARSPREFHCRNCRTLSQTRVIFRIYVEIHFSALTLCFAVPLPELSCMKNYRPIYSWLLFEYV